MEYVELAARHKDFQEEIMYKALECFEPEMKEMQIMAKEVLHDFKQAVKNIKISIKRDILLAELKARHDIEDIVIKHFRKKFPHNNIVLVSNKGCFVGINNKVSFIQTVVQQ